jgi:NAD(P)-dependent dehydrogenase (short-subunit alcohol dehydrogenase family)
MVSLTEVKSANAALRNKHESLTAVFTGATAGIGLATLRAFAKYIPKPKAIVVGRSRSKFEPELQNLQSTNPNGDFTFLEADVSLIKNIDAVCEQIKKQVSSIDLLFTSQGYLSFVGRENNADGLDNSISLRYYGRIRFIQNLLPIMSKNARTVTVLAGGQEGKIFEDDLDLERNYSIANSAGHFAAMLSLTNDKFAEQNPEKGFVHVFPGLVSTGLLGNSATGVLGYLFRWLVQPLLSLFATKPEEAGERMLYYGTSEQYATGSKILDADGTEKAEKVLVEYRQRGMADVVAEHNQKIFESATSR